MLESLFHLVTGSPAFQFLRTVPPFELLPDTAIDQAADELSIEYHSAGRTLFVQGQSQVEHLHIVLKGALEVLDERDGPVRQSLLGAGQHYGGTCLLLNAGGAVLTARTLEDTFFYLLPGQAFLRLCERHREFHDFFADALGAGLLERIGASVRRRWLTGAADEQTAVFNRSVGQLSDREPVFCPPELPIHAAAALMAARGAPALLVGAGSRVIGIVGDRELRERVVAARRNPDEPVSAILSPAPPAVPASAALGEAVGLMVRHETSFLPVSGEGGEIVGLLTEHDLALAQGVLPVDFIREIARTRLRRDLADKHRRTPRLVRLLMLEGVRVEGLAWIVSAIADTTVRRLLDLALEQLGPPPVPFAFLVLGSEGRREQTLATDQDNALVYADPEPAQRAEAEDYFGRLGELVCAWLNEAGYAYCRGGLMASNRRWCQPLSVWKGYFAEWMGTPEPQAVMHSAIFFDFREVYGDPKLAEVLREHVFALLARRPPVFFFHLAASAVRGRPPLGFFGNVVVEQRDGRRRVLDLKGPIANLCDFARLLALFHGVQETNTLARVERLAAADQLDGRTRRDLQRAYSFLMQLRLARQVAASLEGRAEPDNLVDAEQIAPLERRFLEETFKLIERLQDRIKRQFLAGTDGHG